MEVMEKKEGEEEGGRMREAESGACTADSSPELVLPFGRL